MAKITWQHIERHGNIEGKKTSKLFRKIKTKIFEILPRLTCGQPALTRHATFGPQSGICAIRWVAPVEMIAIHATWIFEGHTLELTKFEFCRRQQLLIQQSDQWVQKCCRQNVYLFSYTIAGHFQVIHFRKKKDDWQFTK